MAILVAGRLSEKNPAYVLPALRRYLIQLLTYLDQRFVAFKILVLMISAGFNHIVLLQPHASKCLYVVCSMDSKCREESARLLGCLIRSCPRLILPYIAPIHKVSKT